jgi:hypothetical protein
MYEVTHCFTIKSYPIILDMPSQLAAEDFPYNRQLMFIPNVFTPVIDFL